MSLKPALRVQGDLWREPDPWPKGLAPRGPSGALNRDAPGSKPSFEVKSGQRLEAINPIHRIEEIVDLGLGAIPWNLYAI